MLIRLFVALLLILSLPTPGVAARAQPTAEEMYELGVRYMKRGSPTKALEQFNRVRTYYRDDPFALRAELAIADLQFERNEWDAARLGYEDFLRAHPRYPEIDYVIYRLGLTCYKKAPSFAQRDQTWTQQAVNTWTRFNSRFPESAWRPEVDELLTKARERLARKELRIAEFYADRDAWAAVVGRLEPMLQHFPATTERAAALSLLGEAYSETGRVDLANTMLERLRAESPQSRELRKLTRALE